MNISEVAKKTGLSCKAIRFYEQKQLITPPLRHDNGYRNYSCRQVDELMLLSKARHAGFDLEECRELLRLFRDPMRHSADVKKYTLQKVAKIEQSIQALTTMRQQLLSLAQSCPGNEAAYCPIMDSLTGRSMSVPS